MQSKMTVRFWGVRGSIPSPGSSTVRYGGNTSCTSIHLPGDKALVLDAGSGIRDLGKFLSGNSAEIYIILSHSHWDHIHGFPFFHPIYQKTRNISLFPNRTEHNAICSLLDQMDGAHFPVSAESLPSQPHCVTGDDLEFLRSHGIHAGKIATNHPGGGFGYRIESQGSSAVYLTDNELDPPYAKTTEFDGFVRFCRNADILIHDAQYKESDMPLKHGWGHSLASQACALAAAAEVKHLILYHHDPDRTDDEVDAIQEEAREWLRRHGSATRCTAANEGLTLDL
jgi:phosphoribosyl 1,2-cyclic phosphodiesterase